MNIRQFVVLLAACVVSAFAGGYFASRPPILASAQQIRSQDLIIVPRQGLLFVDETGRVIAAMGQQAGNATFSLLDRNGNASIVFAAGPNSYARLSASGSGTSFEIGSRSGSANVMLAAASGESYVRATGQGQRSAFLRADGVSSSLSLMNSGSALGVSISAGSSTSGIQLFGAAGKKSLELLSAKNGGAINLFDRSGKVGVALFGEQSLQFLKDGEVVWQANEKK
ncbi:MAG: hypothetical protein IH944_03295 [Armatimonadetes bacterium]|nr:hypothetical protein [Armatimonadota bacterium]